MNLFYCSCELCMTQKDISVPLRRALTLTPQHLPVFLLKGWREASAGVIHRGRWQNILWLSTVALCGCSHTPLSLFPCVFVSTHSTLSHLCLLRHAGSTLSAFTGISKLALRKSKDREACSALSLPRWCQCHIHTCILVWEPDYVKVSPEGGFLGKRCCF